MHTGPTLATAKVTHRRGDLLGGTNNVTQTVNETGHRRQNQQKNDRFRPLEPKESIRRQNEINSLFCNKLWQKTGVSVYSLRMLPFR